jgi:hypothetical protein
MGERLGRMEQSQEALRSELRDDMKELHRRMDELSQRMESLTLRLFTGVLGILGVVAAAFVAGAIKIAFF